MNNRIHLRHRTLIQILAILYLALVLTLTHLPRVGPLPDIPGKDKTIHFIAYLLAAVLVLWGFLRRPDLTHAACFILGLLLLGAVDEITQPLVNRTCDLRDWLADAAGIIPGTILTFVFLAKSQRPAIHMETD